MARCLNTFPGMMKPTLIVLAMLFAACQGTLDLETGEAESIAAAKSDAADNTPAANNLSVPTEPAATPAEETEPDPPEAEPPAQTEQPDAPTEPETEEPAESLPEPGSIVQFTIAQGTGNGPWNSADDPVVVYVGQVLELVNLDDTDHQMHASSAAPVPHGGRLVPGQSEQYVVSEVLEVGDSAQMWDHNHGRSAEFWVESRAYPQP